MSEDIHDDILEFIEGFNEEYMGMSPTIREMATALGNCQQYGMAASS
jgi:hypothetical protein